MSLTATIEVPPGQTEAAGFMVRLRVTNDSDGRVAVFNPHMGVPPPGANWPWSRETYQTSMLLSFGYLSMSLADEDGRELRRQDIQTWAQPVIRPEVELAPEDSLEVTIPIGDFYSLESGGTYLLALEYGDRERKVSARGRVSIP